MRRNLRTLWLLVIPVVSWLLYHSIQKNRYRKRVYE